MDKSVWNWILYHSLQTKRIFHFFSLSLSFSLSVPNLSRAIDPRMGCVHAIRSRVRVRNKIVADGWQDRQLLLKYSRKCDIRRHFIIHGPPSMSPVTYSASNTSYVFNYLYNFLNSVLWPVFLIKQLRHERDFIQKAFYFILAYYPILSSTSNTFNTFNSSYGFNYLYNFEVKTSLAAFGRGKIYGLASSWRYCARINENRIQGGLDKHMASFWD